MVKMLQSKVGEIAWRCSQTDVVQTRWKQECCKLHETQEQQTLQNVRDMSALKVRVAALERTEAKASDALKNALWASEQLRIDSDSAKTTLEARTTDVHQNLKTMDINLKQSLQTLMRREMRHQIACTNAECTNQANDLELGRDTTRMTNSHSMGLPELHNEVGMSMQCNELTEAADPIRRIADVRLELETEVEQRNAKLRNSLFCRP